MPRIVLMAEGPYIIAINMPANCAYVKCCFIGFLSDKLSRQRVGKGITILMGKGV
jgi:hypothetical protein